jgi:hypothetical protein|tara:strand:+ start:1986 stop:2549 length:564 start_codon:yes stop_codon:yes gene_type:complete
VNKYLQKQSILQNQAKEILRDLELMKSLKKCGNPVFVGSYALGLMSCFDIDIVVISNPKVENYLKVVKYLFPKQNIYSLSLQDFRKSIHSDRPQGLYCGIKYLVKPKTLWNIDIWFLQDTKAIELVDRVKSKLTNENRLIILKIRNEMREKTKLDEEVSGSEVYEAVLDNGVRNLEEFKKFLNKRSK